MRSFSALPAAVATGAPDCLPHHADCLPHQRATGRGGNGRAARARANRCSWALCMQALTTAPLASPQVRSRLPLLMGPLHASAHHGASRVSTGALAPAVAHGPSAPPPTARRPRLQSRPSEVRSRSCSRQRVLHVPTAARATLRSASRGEITRDHPGPLITVMMTF